MRAILCGPQGSGKTTLFDGLSLHLGAHAADARTHRLLTITLSDDERLVRLKELTGRPKAVPARYTLIDPSHAASQGQKTALMRQADALICVVALFSGADPQEQREQFLNHLREEDMKVVEGRLERVRAAVRKGGAAKKEVEDELPVLEEVLVRLKEGGDLKEMVQNPKKRRFLAHFGLLAAKPVLFVANTAEDAPDEAPEWAYPVSAKLEAELAEMAPDERREFMEEFGIRELRWGDLTHVLYFGSGWGLFYTIGEEEVRAWEMEPGLTAREAAGRIHTDFARHFVRAEVVRYEDVLSCGGWEGAVAAGRMTSVGPDHILHDGDVVYIKAAVR